MLLFLRVVLLYLLFISATTLQLHAQQFFTIALDGNDPAQTATTSGTGSGWAVLSADRTQLTYTFAFARLSGTPTASHFHYGARGRSGGVVQNITLGGNNYITGTWSNIPINAVDSLVTGRIYLNIHTAQFPNGEIRGQLIPTAGVGHAIALNGANQVPAVTTGGRGAGYAVLWSDSTLRYRVTVTGLNSALTASHFHAAAAGQSGGVVQNITFGSPADSTASGSWKLTAAQFDSLRLERLYVNVHTSTSPGGEIRGQVRNTRDQFFWLALDGSDPAQPATTQATGSGWAVLNANKTQLNYTFSFARLTGAPTAAHFHFGSRGRSGGVAQAITLTGNYITGTWTNIPANVVDSLLANRIYVNVHSAQFPGGEIRGQVSPAIGLGYPVALSGTNQVPAVNSPARGAGYAILGTDSTLRYRFSVTGLTTTLTASHFHAAAIGSSGGVVQNISFGSPADSTASGSWIMNGNQLDSLALSRLYVNIHTSSSPGGEIRGQVRLPNTFATSVRQPLPPELKAVSFYPNPAGASATLQFELLQHGTISVQLCSILGTPIATLFSQREQTGIISVPLDLSSYPTGAYYCKIVLPSGTIYVQKLLHIQ